MTNKANMITPDGAVKGNNIDFYFWLGEEGDDYRPAGEAYIEATPEEIEAVDAMFTEPLSGATGMGNGCARMGTMDQYSFDWTGLGR